MAFNFNISGVPTVKAGNSLKPWEIYDVTFDGLEIREFTSKAGNACRVIDWKFTSDKGNATITKFWPTDKDLERRSFDTSNGGKRWMASNAEELWEALKQTVNALSPKGFEKLQAAAAKFKGFDDAIKACDTLLKKCVGQKTQIKLGGYINKSGYPQIDIPSLLSIFVPKDADGAEVEAQTSSIWIGTELKFGDYEDTLRKKYQEKSSAKPSNVEKKVEEISAPVAEESDDSVNWDDLESL